MKNKKDILYKSGLILLIALFVIAMYYNSVSLRDRRFNAAGDENAGGAGTGATGGTIGGNANEGGNANNVAAGGNGGSDGDENAGGNGGSDSATGGNSDAVSYGDAAGVAFNFTLYDSGGAATEFSEYRGNIAFIIFWTPANATSLRVVDTLKDGLPDTVEAVSGGFDVSLISICVPDGDGSQSAAPDGEATGNDGVVDRYVDKDGNLVRLFSPSEYPAIYVFYPGGELCGYFQGDIEVTRIESLIRRAGEYAGG